MLEALWRRNRCLGTHRANFFALFIVREQPLVESSGPLRGGLIGVLPRNDATAHHETFLSNSDAEIHTKDDTKLLNRFWSYTECIGCNPPL